MRIDVVTPWYPSPAHPYRGVFVSQQVAALRRLGADVEVEIPEVFPAPPGPIPRQVLGTLKSLAEIDPAAAFPREGSVTRVPAPVPSGIGPLGRARSFEEFLRLRHDVESTEYDVIHAHLGVPTGAAVMRLARVPVVITEHQSALPGLLEDEDVRRTYRSLIERAAAFLTVSEPLRNLLVDSLGDPVADHIEVVPNIVDFDALAPRATTPTAYRDWLFVGTFVEHKGLGLLLDAFRSYRVRHQPEATLTLVGDGPMRSYVETFTANHQLSRHVTVHGALPHDEVARQLVNADVLVHLSRSETFGIAPIEAIAVGTPVVVRKNGGSESTWGDISSKCGLLVEPDVTPDQVADAVAHLRDNPESLDLPEARRILTGRFSAPVVASRLMDIYRANTR